MDAAVTAPKLMMQKATVMPMARGANVPATQRKAVLSGIVMRKNIPMPSETIPPVSYDMLIGAVAMPRLWNLGAVTCGERTLRHAASNAPIHSPLLSKP